MYVKPRLPHPQALGVLAGHVGSFEGDGAEDAEKELADAFVKIMPSPPKVMSYFCLFLCRKHSMF